MHHTINNADLFSGMETQYRHARQGFVKVSTNWTMSLSDMTSQVMTARPLSDLTYSYHVVCDNGYYGNGCSNICRPRDDNLGHYTCSDDGIVCQHGWTSEYCLTALCLDNCNRLHGYCDIPFECR